MPKRFLGRTKKLAKGRVGVKRLVFFVWFDVQTHQHFRWLKFVMFGLEPALVRTKVGTLNWVPKLSILVIC